MALLPLTFTQAVSLQFARAQAASTAVLDSSVGSPLRALFEATGSIFSWLQVLVLQVRDATRLSTSTAIDVDTFVGDYGLSRLPAVPSVGAVTMARFSAVGSAVVPVGGTVRSTTTGIQDFTITADTTNPAFDQTQNGGAGGYVLLTGVYSVTVPVVATVPGVSGNVTSGTISLLGSPMPGIDTTTNVNPLVGGIDAESDGALKARFQLYIASLSKATLAAIQAAIASVQQGISYTVSQNVDANGVFQPGNFVIRIDDGSGTPPATLITRVYAAVDAVRALAETFSVMPPVVSFANVSLSFSVSQGVNKLALYPQVQSAIAIYISSLGIGVPLSVSRLSYTVFNVDPRITNVAFVTINGSAADMQPAFGGVIKPGAITVS